MGIFSKRPVAPDLSDFDTAIRFLLAKNAPSDASLVEGEADCIHVGESTVNLGNMRTVWSEKPHIERFPWLEGVVQGVFTGSERVDQGLDPSQLRLAVRSNVTLSQAALAAASTVGHFDPAMDVPRAPLAGDLAWVAVVDNPSTMSIVNKSLLDEWGRSADEIFSAARANTPSQPVVQWAAAADKVFMPASADDYLATHIFGGHGLDALPFAEERVVFHPTRNVALVASSVDPVGIALAASMTKDFLDGANPLYPRPLVGSGTDWRPFEPAPDHPAFNSCEMLRATNELRNYESQKPLLQPLVGDELFVAKYALYEIDGRPLSVGTWTSRCNILLPKTDQVSFVEVNDTADGVLSEPFSVAWDDVMAICGNRLEPTTYYPWRWRVVGFPPPEELEQLRTAKVALGS